MPPGPHRVPFSKRSLVREGLFRPSLTNLVDVHEVCKPSRRRFPGPAKEGLRGCGRVPGPSHGGLTALMDVHEARKGGAKTPLSYKAHFGRSSPSSSPLLGRLGDARWEGLRSSGTPRRCVSPPRGRLGGARWEGLRSSGTPRRCVSPPRAYLRPAVGGRPATTI